MMAGVMSAPNHRSAGIYFMLRFCLSVLACLAVAFPAAAGEDDVKRIKAQLAEAFPDLVLRVDDILG